MGNKKTQRFLSVVKLQKNSQSYIEIKRWRRGEGGPGGRFRESWRETGDGGRLSWDGTVKPKIMRALGWVVHPFCPTAAMEKLEMQTWKMFSQWLFTSQHSDNMDLVFLVKSHYKDCIPRKHGCRIL